LKHERPSQPSFNPEFPKKTQLALLLLEEFRRYYPDIIIKCVLADALYGSEEFMVEPPIFLEEYKLSAS
jgi:hypothetical protein